MKKLHVVAFDIPSPPNYGGIIDIYFRLEALKELGVYIVLHCFYKEKTLDLDLSQIANEVYFYKRKMSIWNQFSSLPFIITSRKSTKLIERLNQDDSPILLEGHHCCSVLIDKRIDKSRISIRIHNIEHEYYSGLANNEKHLLKRIYFQFESLKLKRFEKNFQNIHALFCLSYKDLNYYEEKFKHVFYWNIGVELKNEFVQLKQIQDLVIYHGNLSVNENESALLYIIDLWETQQIDKQLNIYGKNPTNKLIERIKSLKKIALYPNPSHEELFDAILHAKFNLSYTHQQTGMKIKLIHNLLHGNICLANDKMVGDTDVEEFVTLFDDSNLKELLQRLELDFHAIQTRKKEIAKIYHPSIIAQGIIKVIFDK